MICDYNIPLNNRPVYNLPSQIPIPNQISTFQGANGKPRYTQLIEDAGSGEFYKHYSRLDEIELKGRVRQDKVVLSNSS